MVNSCCVNNCRNRSHDRRGKRIENGVRYFSFPTWKKHFGTQISELTKRRRMAWVAAVRRKNITFDSTSGHMFVCSRHFHKGKPAYEMMETDPDWAPSLHLGHTEIKQTNPARAARRNKREQLKENKPHPADDQMMTQQAEESDQLHTEEGTHNITQEDAGTQTECPLCMHKCVEINSLLDEKRQSGCDLCQMSEVFFGGDDDQVQYYTGLPNLGTFTALLHFLVPLMPDKMKLLIPFQMLLLTFMRLRLDLRGQHLAHHFHVSPTTANSIFEETVVFLYTNLKHSIVWPDRDTLCKIMPSQFVESFGRRVAVIIDCFKILTGKPSNLNSNGKMFSRYTLNQTIKYLIGITLKGSVCFISKGWSGYRNDKHITQNSGLLENLLPGDIVLDSRGFDKKNVGKLCTGVRLPALTNDSCQPTFKDIELTSKMANHIPVEGAIKNVCQQYKILTGTIPIDMALACKGLNVTFLDKIVTVCCALTNQCQTVA
ncbi:hypothetical protein E1301_Tti009989 [Triplophysa tibetana]|uniref:THAP-type domain-containing protein n=1 Tax=Triplophysa tibetana TaxID=1572043 RepID=A0A5A9NVS1_9TELE|nr:hypothetical protein E1301_Tti009989 [Triplophysa tibetana]